MNVVHTQTGGQEALPWNSGGLTASMGWQSCVCCTSCGMPCAYQSNQALNPLHPQHFSWGAMQHAVLGHGEQGGGEAAERGRGARDRIKDLTYRCAYGVPPNGGSLQMVAVIMERSELSSLGSQVMR